MGEPYPTAATITPAGVELLREWLRDPAERDQARAVLTRALAAGAKPGNLLERLLAEAGEP